VGSARWAEPAPVVGRAPPASLLPDLAERAGKMGQALSGHGLGGTGTCPDGAAGRAGAGPFLPAPPLQGKVRVGGASACWGS